MSIVHQKPCLEFLQRFHFNENCSCHAWPQNLKILNFLKRYSFVTSVWNGVIFVRQGLYQEAVFRFNLNIPENYPNGDCPVSHCMYKCIITSCRGFHPRQEPCKPAGYFFMWSLFLSGIIHQSGNCRSKNRLHVVCCLIMIYTGHKSN